MSLACSNLSARLSTVFHSTSSYFDNCNLFLHPSLTAFNSFMRVGLPRILEISLNVS